MKIKIKRKRNSDGTDTYSIHGSDVKMEMRNEYIVTPTQAFAYAAKPMREFVEKMFEAGAESLTISIQE